jgi:hypothetical protein
MKASTTVILASLYLFAAALPGMAIEPVKKEALVYRLQSFAANEYATVYSPPQADEIHLIADTDNAFDPRTTLIFYWPLSREYFESWETLDVAVQGRMEILSRDSVVQRLSRVPVAFSYMSAAAQGESTLLAERDAEDSSAAYRKVNDEYEKSMAAYGEAMLRYRAELRRFMQTGSAGDGSGAPPKEPREPEPPRWFVTQPASLFVLHLPQGRYAVRMRDENDEIIEGSERKLVVFPPVGGKGIGYQVMPEERWTSRMQSDTPRDTLYCTPGKELYLLPYETRSYREDLLLRLKNPQNQDPAGSVRAVYTEPSDAQRLLLFRGEKAPLVVERSPYYVKQAKGAELGYSILPWSKDVAGADSPTFVAFRLKFADSDAGVTYRIGIQDPRTGAILASSERTVCIVIQGRWHIAWLISCVPLAGGVCVFIWRRRKA